MELLSRILPVRNIVLDLAVTSKKRAFEQASLLFENNNGIERAAVFESLFNRERLGSTALGGGIAVPHGRVKGIKHPAAAFFRLARPIAFDAHDGGDLTLPGRRGQHHQRARAERQGGDGWLESATQSGLRRQPRASRQESSRQ